jgi:hypothetical protein
MPDDSRIDPRYAAQFQRGFDPATAPPAARSGSVRTDAPRKTVAPPPGEDDVAPPTQSDAQTTLDEQATPDEQTTPDEEATPDEQPAPRLTWWDWLLPAFGTVLVATALVLWWGFATDGGTIFGTGLDRWSAFLQLARYELPGPLLIAGMIALTVGIAMRATKSRR